MLNRLLHDLALPLLCLSLALAASTSFGTQVIANWDVVPFQRLDHPFKVGVVAFHETGVRLNFSVNGGEITTIETPTWNDRTGVFEYWIEIDPADYPDGLLTVAATAVPKGSGHQSRTLQDLVLYANHGQTIGSQAVLWVDADGGSDATGNGSENNPYQTIRKALLEIGDGGTVYLKAGRNYKLTSIGGGGFNHWTTVSAAPGLTADDVHVLTYGRDSSSTGRYGKNRIRWHNLSLYCDRNPGWGSLLYFENGYHTWFDAAVLYDANGRWANSNLFNGSGYTTYLTDSHVRDVSNSGGSFHRNLLIENIGADVYRGSSNLTAINVTVRKMDRGQTDAHPDFIQFYNPNRTVENLILYNVKVYDMMAQGIFGVGGTNAKVKDFAMVNLILEKKPPESALRSQLTGDWEHVLLWNTTIVDQTFDFRSSAGIESFDLRNGVFARLTSDNPNHPSITIRNAHVSGLQWNQSAPLGEQATIGDPRFVDKAASDFRLRPDSPAYQTGILAPDVPADVDGFPYQLENPNRGAFSQTNPGPIRNRKHSAQIIEFDQSTGRTNVTTVLKNSPNQRFRIEVSADLQAWELLPPRYSDHTGRIDLTDPTQESTSHRFYRFTPIYFPHPEE